MERTTTPDDMDMATVSARLGKSARWLQRRLAEDRRRPPNEQILQHHHYIGRSPRWHEAEYQALRQAIEMADTPAHRPVRSDRARNAISTELPALMDAEAAVAKVLAYGPGCRPIRRQSKR